VRALNRGLDHSYTPPLDNLSSQFVGRGVELLLVFLAVTLLATAVVGADADTSRATLPDTPSTLLGLRSQLFAKDASETQLSLSEVPSVDQPVSDQNTRPPVFRRALQDQKEIYTAPFHRRNLKWDLAFLAATGGLIAADRHISGTLSRDHIDVSRHISDIGMYSMTVSVAGIWLSGLKTGDEHARETGILAAESFGNTAALVGVMQLIAGRERPTEGNGNGCFWQHNAFGSSFPSAHSSFTWTMASVVAHEYPKPWVRWLVYGTATTVSLTRVTGLKHFSSDVAVGGASGYLIGQHIFNAYHKRDVGSRHCSRKRVSAEK